MRPPKGIKKLFRTKTRAGVVLLLIVAVSAFGTYFIHGLLSADNGRPFFNSALIRFAAPEVQTQLARYEKVIYPYSVIRGGARSREELSANVRTDHVVAEHYSDFDVNNARIIKAPETRAMYVSYRVGNNIYWTANKVTIPEGEALITDGNIEARVRCGNLISATEMTPLSGDEPDSEYFDIPQVARLDDSELEPFIEPGLTPLSQFPEEVVDDPLTPLSGGNVPTSTTASGYPPPGLSWVPSYPAGPSDPGNPGNPGGSGNPGGPGGPGEPGGPGGPPTEPPSEVPEPGTMIMVLTGLAVVVFIRIHGRSSSK